RSQGVYGSGSVRSSWRPLREAGAKAREMLIEAAAQQWSVDKAELRAENGAVVSRAGALLSYGSLAEAASKLPVPAEAKLKDPSEYRLIGKPMKRLDTPSKTDGSAQFGIDFRIPGMLYAVIERCPVFGGKPASFDASKTKQTPGVKHVVEV